MNNLFLSVICGNHKYITEMEISDSFKHIEYVSDGYTRINIDGIEYILSKEYFTESDTVEYKAEACIRAHFQYILDETEKHLIDAGFEKVY